MVDIEPTIKLSGSAFRDNNLNNSRPISRLKEKDNIKLEGAKIVFTG